MPYRPLSPAELQEQSTVVREKMGEIFNVHPMSFEQLQEIQEAIGNLLGGVLTNKDFAPYLGRSNQWFSRPDRQLGPDTALLARLIFDKVLDELGDHSYYSTEYIENEIAALARVLYERDSYTVNDVREIIKKSNVEALP